MTVPGERARTVQAGYDELAPRFAEWVTRA
jgi:hypothetical protein